MTDPTEPSSLPGSADALRAQPTVPSAELARVQNDGLLRVTIADLERQVEKGGWNHRTMTDAARLMRELRTDFGRYAQHEEECPCWFGASDDETPSAAGAVCTCGLDAARAKWRLEP